MTGLHSVAPITCCVLYSLVGQPTGNYSTGMHACGAHSIFQLKGWRPGDCENAARRVAVWGRTCVYVCVCVCVCVDERVATGAGNTAPLMPMMSTERDLGAPIRGVSRGHECTVDDLCLSDSMCLSITISMSERGSERRRHPVREQAPGPAREGGARQHADGGRDPERDPQQREGGVPDRRHLQARQGHRALPLQEEDQSPGKCYTYSAQHHRSIDDDLLYVLHWYGMVTSISLRCSRCRRRGS
jgi:hypothetical protein